ncbi:hypothetical protein OIU79_022947 [Salix purpurea]|uniref:Uncharacterized protein n=1 Tax=Salix purpurea TaxID=77065 RepID=A0A9Q0WHL6_SALPP|nr:hypothetical protein OIU79_022947 [Salix purpurea]
MGNSLGFNQSFMKGALHCIQFFLLFMKLQRSKEQIPLSGYQRLSPYGCGVTNEPEPLCSISRRKNGCSSRIRDIERSHVYGKLKLSYKTVNMST